MIQYHHQKEASPMVQYHHQKYASPMVQYHHQKYASPMVQYHHQKEASPMIQYHHQKAASPMKHSNYFPSAYQYHNIHKRSASPTFVLRPLDARGRKIKTALIAGGLGAGAGLLAASTIPAGTFVGAGALSGLALGR